MQTRKQSWVGRGGEDDTGELHLLLSLDTTSIRFLSHSQFPRGLVRAPLLSSTDDTKAHSGCEWLLMFCAVPSCLASLSLSPSDERSGGRSLVAQSRPLCLDSIQCGSLVEF